MRNERDQATGDEADRNEERIEERAQLLPEEEAVGSADTHAQAESILVESEERAAQAERDVRAGAEPIERRDSDETI